MNVEGARRKRPGRIAVRATEHARRILMCQASMQSAKNRYRGSADRWKAGLLTPPETVRVAPEVAGPWIGLIGENAFKDYTNRHFDDAPAAIDLNLRDGGDSGIDLAIYGLSIQIKTRTKEDSVCLVRRADESRRLVPMRSKAHVFCQYSFDDRDWVYLLGWTWTKDIEPLPLVRARVGSHFNAEVDDRDLLPMSRLIDELRFRKESRQWR